MVLRWLMISHASQCWDRTCKFSRGWHTQLQWAARFPHQVHHDYSQIDAHYLSVKVVVPYSNDPFRWSRDERCGMEVVTPYLIDCQQVPSVCLLVLPTVSTRAFVNLAFFSAVKEWKLARIIKIEAHATCQTNEAALFFAFSQAWLPLQVPTYFSWDPNS